MNLHEELRIALEAAADPTRAAPMQAYMRDQFIFLGVAAPLRRLAARDLLAGLKGVGADVLLEHAQRLWQQRQREYQHVALDMLDMHRRQLNIAHLPALLALARQRAWWDSVDGMAATAMRTWLTPCAMRISGCAASPCCTSWAGAPTRMPPGCSARRWRWPPKTNFSSARPSAGPCAITRAMRRQRYQLLLRS